MRKLIPISDRVLPKVREFFPPKVRVFSPRE